MSAGPTLAMLARPLRPAERAAIEKRFRGALRGGRSCALPATAFVSLYERGRIAGCVGHADLAHALAAARVDPRFGGVRSAADVAVQLSLLVRGRTIPTADVPRAITLGADGLVAFDEAGAIRAVLLPDVAADGQRDGDAMLRALLEKAGAESIDELPRTMLVGRERFVVRPRTVRPKRRSAVDAAAAWLASLVDDDGTVAHGIDARGGRVHRTGPFHVGRAAVVVDALDAHGGHRAVVQRARAWLARVATDGDGLPRAAVERAATLALVARAGADVSAALRALAVAEAHAIAAVPWHAAQVACVLGIEAPEPVLRAALAAIDQDAFAPWSVLAADVLGDRARAKRGRARLARAIPTRGPHPGGVRTRSAPELAMTAIAVEALAPSKAHRAAVRRALAFLETHRFATERHVPAAVDPALAVGAYPLAPHADFLRGDVTAHALMATLAAIKARRAR